MSVVMHDHDRVAYPALPYPDTHPDRMAVMGILHGLKPAPVERCRVLEIGCNEGANLIPLAYAIPGSEFVGFDIAEVPVAKAQGRIRELGLANIHVFQADLMEAGDALGAFDYIIAHGVYAWVSEAARDALLRLCREHLTPDGIAFISYNALPGGHIRNMMKAMLDDVPGLGDDRLERISQGVNFLGSIQQFRVTKDGFSAFLEDEANELKKRNIRQIYHDEFSTDERPILFSKFIAHAAKHDLRYVCESRLMPPNDPSYQPEAVAMARERAQGDPIAEEQILDFVRMRRYRETLLCRAEAVGTHEISAESFQQLYLASPAESSAGGADGARLYTAPDGKKMEFADIGAQMLIECLMAAWPQAISFAEMEQTLAAKGVRCDSDMMAELFSMVCGRVIQLHAWQAPVSSGIAERPRASASGRQEAAAGGLITTLHHLPMTLGDKLAQRFLTLLDGSRDRKDLSAALQQDFPGAPAAAIAGGIEAGLQALHRAAVLLAEDFVRVG